MRGIDRITICSESDIYVALGVVRQTTLPYLAEMDRQKVLVSSSELLRNILDHAGGNGIFSCDLLMDNRKVGVRIKASDYGPGIYDIEKALRGEQTAMSRGLGIGLSSVKRLMDEFHIETSAKGTTITAIKWVERRGDTVEQRNH